MSSQRRTPVCRVCCVSGDAENLFVLKNKKIKKLFEQITTINFQATGRPRKICNSCKVALVEFYDVMQMEKKSQIILNKLAARGQKATPETIDAMMQEMSLNPGRKNGTFKNRTGKIECIDLSQEDSNECIDLTEEVSVEVTVERLDNPLDESTVWEKND